MHTVRIGTRLIGNGQPAFIIAEAGVNHDGSLEKAKKLVDIAKEAGVDAVKFQTWKTEALILQGTKKAAYQEENTKAGKEESQFDMIKKLELSYNDFREIKRYCDKKDVLFLSTPDEEESAEFLNGLGVPCFKIGSGELTNYLLLRYIAKFGKPIILSTGMGTIEECRKAHDAIFSTGNKILIMLHCTSDYPTLFSDVNLRAMETLGTEMNHDANVPVLIGYSDHTEGITVPVVAVAQGAAVIEKHFTYDKSAVGPDHRASLSPKELHEMVKKIRETETILGSQKKQPTLREQETKKVVRKSLVAKVWIAKGDILTEEKITAKRADARGFTADQCDEVIGKRAAKNSGVDEIIDEKSIEIQPHDSAPPKTKRKICVVTGTRAEYGILRPVIAAIKKHPHLELQLIAAGMHLSDEFGMTKNDIEQDGHRIDAAVAMLPETDDDGAMAVAAARGITGFVDAFKKISPGIVVVLGDRIEAFAATIAASFLNIPVAHVSGGDKTRAGRDEEMRHAITKFAKIHFPATKTSGERITKMGEDAWRVFVVGEPSIDTMLQERLLEKEELKKYALSLDFTKQYAVVVQHPVTTEAEKAGEQMRATLEAVNKEKIPALIFYPNADSGGRRMIEVIKEYEKIQGFLVAKSLPHTAYLSVLKHAAFIIGNSSSGIVEAPTLKVAAINIGIRQEGRECASNVVHVDDNEDNEQQIRRAITTVFSLSFREQLKNCINPYGSGDTSTKIAEVLATIPVNDRLLKKTITY